MANTSNFPDSDYTGTLWKHSKSEALYQFLHEARQEVDLSHVVVYKSLDTSTIWVRPRSEFFDGRFEHIQIRAQPAT